MTAVAGVLAEVNADAGARGDRARGMRGRPVDPVRSRIILVGVPAYDDPRLLDVPVVASNIADLAAAFTDSEIGGFDASHCVVAPPRASVAEVGDLLTRGAAEAEDLLLFYYSGHGLLGTRSHELYLSLAATRLDSVGFTALPFAAVRDACMDSGAESRVVILDSCFSGRAIGATLGADNEVLAQVEVAGTYTLTSAPANRTALILPGEQHTAFTERLLRLLHEGSPHAGEMLSLGDIYRHLHGRLRAEGLPVPQQRGTETADLLGLVRNRFAPVKAGGDPATPITAQPVTPQVSADARPRSRATAAVRIDEFREYTPPEIPGNIPRNLEPLNLAMWGAPASGKTTFLCTLNLALQRIDSGWNLTAANSRAEELLVNTAAQLIGDGAFPAATLTPEEYPWTLQGQVLATVRRGLRKEHEPVQVRIPLELTDWPGGTAGSDDGQLIDPLDQLLGSSGIFFMFDPVRELHEGDSYERITALCSQAARVLGDSRLGQFIAVCVTKFDEPRVLEMAREMELIAADRRDPHRFPRVHDDDARKFFRHLCEASAGRNGDMVVTALERYFRPERIKYFVTSAVGFYTDPQSRTFNPDDLQNVIPVSGVTDSPQVRGSIRPINIGEPLLWLTQQIITLLNQTGSRARLSRTVGSPAGSRTTTADGPAGIYKEGPRIGKSVRPADGVTRTWTRAGFGDMISYQNDRKCCAMIVG